MFLQRRYLGLVQVCMGHKPVSVIILQTLRAKFCSFSSEKYKDHLFFLMLWEKTEKHGWTSMSATRFPDILICFIFFESTAETSWRLEPAYPRTIVLSILNHKWSPCPEWQKIYCNWRVAPKFKLISPFWYLGGLA